MEASRKLQDVLSKFSSILDDGTTNAANAKYATNANDDDDK